MSLMEASDSIGLGQPGFIIGDGSVNLPWTSSSAHCRRASRRAVVPAEFKLLRKNQVPYYMEDRWPVVSYLELSLRKQSDSSPAYLCSQVDGSCICNPNAAMGGVDLQANGTERWMSNAGVATRNTLVSTTSAPHMLTRL